MHLQSHQPANVPSVVWRLCLVDQLVQGQVLIKAASHLWGVCSISQSARASAHHELSASGQERKLWDYGQWSGLFRVKLILDAAFGMK